MKIKIYDAHAHIFPDKIAQKATTSIGEFYGFDMEKSGTADSLIKEGLDYGVTGFLVSSSATTPKQVMPLNDFIASQCKKHANFVGFGSMHPYFENYEAELERMCELGLKGVKFHHDFLKINLDDPDSIKIYKKIADLNLRVLFHMGDDRFDYTHPKRLANLMDRVPNLKCIAAHFGGYRIWDESEKALKGRDLLFDTSSSLFQMGNDLAMHLIDIFGEDNFLFGTDYPMWDFKGELERFNRLPLTERQREKILYKNFEREILGGKV